MASSTGLIISTTDFYVEVAVLQKIWDGETLSAAEEDFLSKLRESREAALPEAGFEDRP